MKTRTFDNPLSPVSLEENREVEDHASKQMPFIRESHRRTHKSQTYKTLPLRMLRDLVISPDKIILFFFFGKVLLNPSYFNTPCSSFSHMFLEMLFPSTLSL